jgi:putative oxidoreductase
VKRLATWLWFSGAPAATVLVRLMVGAVFLSEGLQKFMFDARGSERFTRIGIPAPTAMAAFVGVVEVLGGALVLLGLLTRPAACLLLVNISVAIVSTKIPILLGYGFWGFSAPSGPHHGFWLMAHAARTDFCMWTGSFFLILVGAGPLSIDALVRPKPPAPDAQR